MHREDHRYRDHIACSGSPSGFEASSRRSLYKLLMAALLLCLMLSHEHTLRLWVGQARLALGSLVEMAAEEPVDTHSVPSSAEPKDKTGENPASKRSKESGTSTEAASAPGRAELLRENSTLKLKVAELQRGLRLAAADTRSAREEAVRYRRGLERAVAELNRQGKSQRASARPQRQTRRSKARRATARSRKPRVIESEARLQVLGDQIFVHGSLKNGRKELASGTLWIELMHDGRLLERVASPAEIEARGKLDYEHRFHIMGLGEGTLSAHARLEAF